jgi:hypothetical protein
MLQLVVLLGVMAISLYCASYGLWAWRQNNRRGAVGIFIISLITLLLPVTVWIYHGTRS